MITIKEVDNGYILIKDYEDKDSDQEVLVVDTEGLDDDEEMAAVLTRVAEMLGYSYDKWSKNNLKISFDQPGHKVDDEE